MQKYGALTPLKNDCFRPLWASTVMPTPLLSALSSRKQERQREEHPCELKENAQHEGAAAITERTDASKVLMDYAAVP
ncbi:unnamed protein product [Arctogadus glacialis]